MNLTVSMTMRRALDLIGIHDPADLSAQAKSLPATHPLRRVDELLIRCLYDIESSERAMRTGLEALKAAVDRETEHLDQGYTTGDWPTHYAGKAEAGRQKLVHAFEQVNLLAPLRQLLHTHAGTDPATPPGPEPAGAGT